MKLFRRFGSRRGDALIEFTLMGLPIIFITTSIVAMGLDMFEFHNLAYATDSTARYISMHGANGSAITVGNIATYFEGQGISLSSGVVNLSLTNSAGTVTPCNPVSSCEGSSTVFPDTSHNAEGTNITVSATYVLKNPIFLLWPPDTVPASDFTVGATSTQLIIY